MRRIARQCASLVLHPPHAFGAFYWCNGNVATKALERLPDDEWRGHEGYPRDLDEGEYVQASSTFRPHHVVAFPSGPGALPVGTLVTVSDSGNAIRWTSDSPTRPIGRILGQVTEGVVQVALETLSI